MKRLERKNEAKKVYMEFWDSYQKGDEARFASTIHDDFEMIGTSASEICHSKKEGIEFLRSQIEEVVGKVEMRNRQIKLQLKDSFVLVNESSDIYILADSEWRFYANLRISTWLKDTESGWKVTQQHGSFPDMRVKEGETMAIEKINKENLELRDAIKRRTAELENKSRELEIEAALERVRSRSMAMHTSEELKEVSALLDHEVRSLGIKTWGCAFNIYGENDSSEWFSTQAGVMPPYKTPRENIFKKYYNLGQQGKTFHIQEFKGKKCIEHYEYLCTLPEAGEALRAIKESGGTFPEYQLDHVAFFKQGYLLFITLAPIPEAENIFPRFAKVFEQTYTRFLDLQKAEVQAREAQIQLSLERVRAKSMAMQSSDELHDVLSTLFQQFDVLGIKPVSVFLSLFDREKRTLTYRASGKSGMRISGQETVSIDSLEAWSQLFDKWKNDNSDEVEVIFYAKEILPTLFELLSDTFASMPAEERMTADDFPDGGYTMHGYTPFGYLGYNHTREATEEEKNILTRFAIEFSRVYQRFLDIQKAEAQAREAQIEVALEKIRSRTMAMQKGEEVKDVVVLLYKELIALGVTNFTTCGYVEINEETERQLTYVTDQGGDSLGLFYLPLEGDEVFDERYAAWKNQQAVFHQTVGGKERRKHLEYAITTFNSKEAEEMVLTQFPDPTVFYCFNFSHGYLHIVGSSILTTEEETLMARFTRVFEQTYARFLDLKKAEIQTRAAQINLAVERVRAKALAMHKSDEIMEVVAKLKDEVMGLNIPGVVAATIFLEADNNYIRMWDLSALERSDKGYLAITDITFKLKKVDPYLYIKRVWENNENYFVEVQNSKDLDRIIEFMYENNQLEVAKEVEDYTRSTNLQQLYHASKRLNNGKLCIDLLEPPSDEMEGILNKIGAAFDLAYKRFEDLQKAEAQTREAQIEAALERVRAKAMSMQSSDELDEVLSVLCEQFDILGILPMSTHMTVFDFENNTFTFRETGKFGNRSFGEQTVELDAMDNWKETVDKWKIDKATAINKLHFPKEQLPKVWEVFHESFASMPEGSRITPEDYPDGIYHTAGKHPFGYIGMNQIRLATQEEEQIVIKFASEFGRAYQRFLDLKKAEAQAREAIIEAALERVRSRSMGMQNSSELEDIIQVVLNQFIQLGITVDHSGFIMDYKSRDDMHIWLADEHKVTSQITLPYFDSPHWNSYNEAKKKGDNLFLNHLDFKEKNKFYKHIFKYVPDLPEDAKTFYLECPSLTIATTLADNIGLYIENYSGIQYSVENQKTLIRFGKVFQQTYTRFLDLQKAEAQAREAQIEAALEKVRSRTMAMQKSEELPLAANNLFLQVQELGIPAWSAGYCIWQDDKRSANCNMSSEGEIQKGFILPSIGEGYDFYAPQKKGENFYVKELGGEALVKHYEFMKELPNVGEILKELTNAGLELPTFQIFHIFYFKFGYVMFITYEEVHDAHDIFKRFGQVFEQTYTRFLDLERAEAQAREAQIEMALEKVRSRTMAMQKSDELQDAAQVLFNEIRGLGILSWSCGYNILSDDKKSAECWMSSEGALQKPFTLYYEKEKSFVEQYDFFKSKKTFLVQEQKGRDLVEAYEYMKTIPKIGEIIVDLEESGISLPTHQFNHLCKFNKGYLLFITYEPVPEAHEIFVRFTKVFDQTYTRFLDLKDAEARARESQIQAALERVRSQSMGMQSTNDFGAVTTEMFNQLRNFGEDLYATGIVFCDKHEGHVEQWHSIPGGGMLSPMIVPIDLDYIHQYRYDQWKARKELFSIEIPSDFIEKHFEDIFNLPSAQVTLKDLESRNAPMPATPSWEIDYGASFKHGYILASSLQPLENMDILPRFAKVFEQAYTRFLDLQKAEAQAREAKIEASLERVRAKTMAMHKSEDLSEVATVLFEQISLLTETPSRFNIAILNEEEQLFDIWVTDQKGHNLNKLFVFDVQKSEIVAEVYKAFQAKERHIIQHMSGKRLKSWIEYASKEAGVPFDKEDIKEDRYINSIFFKHGCIGITTDEMPDESVIQLLERFTKVFEQTFTRFLDLEKAEAQAREAKIEAALEKVRSRSLAMHQSTEMQKVVNEIQEQVLFLGLKIDALAMSGVIDNESDYDVWVGGANSQKPLRIPYNNDTKIQRDFNKAIKERPDLFTKTYTGKVVKDYFKALMGTGNSFNPEIEQFMLTSTGFTTSLTFMKNSGIQIIRYTEESFSDAENAIVIRFGKVFEQAYIRFLDLQKAEAQTLLAEQNLIQLKTEKQRAEEALSELQQTQTQLIQSEKMASLGELTAGIAHEIQNPLNFVNNFSEVSNELLDEIQEEIENGDFEEVKALIDDIKQNLEKINHHGKRADAIVKGMLQHSRSSTGTKELTNINDLADEYLRLAYHGLRAKDKSFNATMDTDYDESISEIEVIPQDMGRVILNLITNSFYAVNEKRKAGVEGYNPTVSISTKKKTDTIEISVSDNGGGIPQKVLDKIFQPFFTTKPTGQGTGLGLSMSYDIITKGHGGKLNVETKEGAGSKFSIHLPINN
jgi:signal transduction histidine kinase